MSDSRIFECPSCAAALRPDGAALQVRCPYCGTTVIVPASLRQPLPAPPPVIVQAPPLPPQPYRPPPRARASGCSTVFSWLVVILIFAGFLGFAAIMNSDPQFFTRLIEPGPADLTATFGGEGTGPGLFQDASGIAVDGNGIVYVSDNKAHRVEKFDLTGAFLSEWSFDVAIPYGSGRMAADRAGHLYMAWADKILHYDGADGKLLGVFTSHRDGSFIKDSFDDVTVLPDGSVLAMGNLISEDLVHFSPDGTVLGRIDDPIRKQTDQSEIETHLAADGLGDLFLLGHGTHVVYHFAPDGKYLNQFGSEGDAPDQFNQPLGDLAIDNQSRIYVGDWDGIQVYEPPGRYVGRIAKQGTTAPGEMAFSDANDLFVATGWGKQVLKYTLKKPADTTK